MPPQSQMNYYSAPGRVCLYGEHQDYLKLKVIPSAINLRTQIGIKLTENRKITIKSSNIQISDVIDCTKKIQLKNNEFDYLRAILTVLLNEEKIKTIPGMQVEITSQVPIGSGLSSSAALLVAWLTALNYELDLNLNSEEIAYYSFKAENEILGINCGIMDQYSSSLGGIFSLDCDGPPYKIKKFNSNFNGLIIGDSLVRRAANEPLTLLKNQLYSGISKLEKNSAFSLKTITQNELEENKSTLTSMEFQRLQGAITIRDITIKAEQELQKPEQNLLLLGELLTKQQLMLKENLKVSIPELDNLVNVSLKAGALGAKLTGAGFGGCIVAFAPGIEEKVARAIEAVGGKAIICNMDLDGGKKEK